jgi:hypothetical protein
MNNGVAIFSMAALPSCGMSLYSLKDTKNIAAALFFAESIAGHKQPCQSVNAMPNRATPLFLLVRG